MKPIVFLGVSILMLLEVHVESFDFGDLPLHPKDSQKIMGAGFGCLGKLNLHGKNLKDLSLIKLLIDPKNISFFLCALERLKLADQKGIVDSATVEKIVQKIWNSVKGCNVKMLPTAAETFKETVDCALGKIKSAPVL